MAKTWTDAFCKHIFIRCYHESTQSQRERMKDDVKHKPAYTRIQTHTRYSVLLSKWLSYSRQSISYHTLRNEKSMLLHGPCNSSPAKSTKQNDCLFRAKKSHNTEHEVPQSGDTTANNTVLINAISKSSYKKEIFAFMNHNQIFAESSTQREADCTILTWNPTVLWSVSLLILVDWVCACSADNVKFMKHNWARLYANFQPSVDARWQCGNKCSKSSECTGSTNIRANGMWSFWNSDGFCWESTNRGALGYHLCTTSAHNYLTALVLL